MRMGGRSWSLAAALSLYSFSLPARYAHPYPLHVDLLNVLVGHRGSGQRG